MNLITNYNNSSVRMGEGKYDAEKENTIVGSQQMIVTMDCLRKGHIYILLRNMIVSSRRNKGCEYS